MKTLVSLAAGIALRQPEINLLAKIDKVSQVVTVEMAELRQNPYSGKTVSLSPFLASLHDFIIVSYRRGVVGSAFPVSVWDRARYLFLRLNPEAYYDLID